MKKILITGANSYIGTSFEKWTAQWPDKYIVDTIDMIDDLWKEKDFSGYDVIFHVAGIAHLKETKKNKHIYYKVNRDLTYQVAKKAKEDKVKLFIFLSSMSVYGIKSGIITADTIPIPKNNYGKSKIQAEKLIMPLQDNNFRIAILRPPMVYGKGCKGNYSRLAKLALKTPIFPDIDNKRSMIYIDNLCEFIRLLIDDCSKGLFYPQNSEYVRTSEMVKLIAEVNGKRMRMVKSFNWAIWIGVKLFVPFKKVFGSLIYEREMPGYYDFITNDAKLKYQCITFIDSINMTEKDISKEKNNDEE